MIAAYESIIYAPIVIDEMKWLNFTQSTQYWYNESQYWYNLLQDEYDTNHTNTNNANETTMITADVSLPNTIWSYSNKNDTSSSLVQRVGRGNFVPSFLISPPPSLPSSIKSKSNNNQNQNHSIYQNIDLFSNIDYKSVTTAAVKLKDTAFTKFLHQNTLQRTSRMMIVDTTTPTIEHDHMQHPHSVAAQPVYNTLDKTTNKIVGYLYSMIGWDHFLHNLLPNGVYGIQVILRNSCNQSVTYRLHGNQVRKSFHLIFCFCLY
jgi:hypothetical protein